MEPILLAAVNADVDALQQVLGEGVSPNAVTDGLVPLQYLRGRRHPRLRAHPPQRHRRDVYPEAAAAPAGDGSPRRRVRVPRGGLLSKYMCLWTTGVYIYTRSGD